ncbi:MAG: hypothetical protein FJY37_20610 [Betaproteobacteria bacterium]|nr:hypothetical protein [Betaproteobacteria bacterium]
MKILLISAATLLSMSAGAAEWEYAAATGTSNVYVDLARIGGTPQKRTGWFLFDHLETRYDIDSARVFKSSTHLIEIDCASQSLNWLRMEKFTGPLATGTRVSARDIDTLTANFLESIPDPARQAMAEVLCVVD